MDKLRPCPFCGGKPGLYLSDPAQFIAEGEPKEPFYSIRCSECMSGTANFFSIQKAAEAWNRRTEEGEQNNK